MNLKLELEEDRAKFVESEEKQNSEVKEEKSKPGKEILNIDTVSDDSKSDSERIVKKESSVHSEKKVEETKSEDKDSSMEKAKPEIEK